MEDGLVGVLGSFSRRVHEDLTDIDEMLTQIDGLVTDSNDQIYTSVDGLDKAVSEASDMSEFEQTYQLAKGNIHRCMQSTDMVNQLLVSCRQRMDRIYKTSQLIESVSKQRATSVTKLLGELQAVLEDHKNLMEADVLDRKVEQISLDEGDIQYF